MKKLLIYSISCLTVFGFISCQKTFNTVVELDIPYTPLITINASNGMSLDSFLVYVKGSKGITDTGECPVLSQATVQLFEDGSLLNQLNYVPDHLVYANGWVNFLEGKRYTLKVQAPGYAAVETTDTMPKRPANISYVFKRNARYLKVAQDPSMWYDELKLQFNDDASMKNYYSLRVNYERNDLAEVAQDVFSFGPTLFSLDPDLDQENADPTDSRNGVFYSKLYFNDNNFNGKTKELVVYIPNGNTNSIPDSMASQMVFYFAFEHLSKNAYEYEKTNKLYWENEGNPFSEPVQIKQNVINGVGNFRLKYRFIDSLTN